VLLVPRLLAVKFDYSARSPLYLAPYRDEYGTLRVLPEAVGTFHDAHNPARL
jgi:hypothetical protein